MANKNRKLLFERHSSSGKLLLRYYDTGCVVGFNSDNLAPTKNGEGGILRVTGLKNADLSESEMDTLFEKLDQLAPYEYIFDIDVSSVAKAGVLRDYLAYEAHEHEERLLALSALLSNLTVSDHETSFRESLAFVERNRGNLTRALEANSLRFMASRYLGLASSPLGETRGRLSTERVDQIWESEGALAEHRIFKNFVSDFNAGVPLVGLERRKRKRYDESQFNVRMESPSIFPLEGFEQMHKQLLQSEAMVINLDVGLSHLTYHALKNGGASRASEFVRFLTSEVRAKREAERDSGYPSRYSYLPYYHRMEEFLEVLPEGVTIDGVMSAIEDEDIPFDLAIMVA